MCGIAGAIHLRGEPVADLERRLAAMGELIAHRGPDDHGIWTHPQGHVGFAHRRLSIFDLSASGHQPMADPGGRVVTYNGEIYNWPEVRSELGGHGWRTQTDTEVLLRSHERWGPAAVDRLRGMFAYGLWDERCSVIITDHEYDAGPIVLEKKVPVLPDDTPESLAARVFEAECEAYPEGVRIVAQRLGLIA